MSEFKNKGGHLTNQELENLDKNSIFQAKQKNGVFYYWKTPILIRAQTYADMDFRKEWYGDDLVYEGNNYGDTSDFYIIGSFYDK